MSQWVNCFYFNFIGVIPTKMKCSSAIIWIDCFSWPAVQMSWSYPLTSSNNILLLFFQYLNFFCLGLIFITFSINSLLKRRKSYCIPYEKPFWKVIHRYQNGLRMCLCKKIVLFLHYWKIFNQVIHSSYFTCKKV
jgi:hypothetical protein